MLYSPASVQGAYIQNQIALLHTSRAVCQEGDPFLGKCGKEGKIICSVAVKYFIIFVLKHNELIDCCYCHFVYNKTLRVWYF